jgi:hypothetical protein
VTLADVADAHDETNIASLDPSLVRVEHHAWIAERGTLDGVLARESGAEEESAGRRKLTLRTEPVRELFGMLQEDFGQAMVSFIESSQYIGKTPLYLFVRQLQDSL